MRDRMRHHRREFALVTRGSQQAGREEHKSARQGRRFLGRWTRGHLRHRELPRWLGTRHLRRQHPAHAVYITSHGFVFEGDRLATQLPRVLPAHRRLASTGHVCNRSRRRLREQHSAGNHQDSKRA